MGNAEGRVFKDGTSGYVDESHESVRTFLGLLPVPELDEIVSDPEFRGVEITREVFERIWNLAIQKKIIEDLGVKFE